MLTFIRVDSQVLRHGRNAGLVGGSDEDSRSVIAKFFVSAVDGLRVAMEQFGAPQRISVDVSVAIFDQGRGQTTVDYLSDIHRAKIRFYCY